MARYNLQGDTYHWKKSQKNKDNQTIFPLWAKVHANFFFLSCNGKEDLATNL